MLPTGHSRCPAAASSTANAGPPKHASKTHASRSSRASAPSPSAPRASPHAARALSRTRGAQSASVRLGGCTRASSPSLPLKRRSSSRTRPTRAPISSAVPVNLPAGGLPARRNHDVEVLGPAVNCQVTAGQLQVHLLQFEVVHRPADASLPDVEAGQKKARLLEERGKLLQDLLAAPGHRAVHRLHDQRAALQERPAHSESKQR
mmetsp:Transcript_25455/g.78385  ORF Transcript_25455/g.78385 Transcript_25455/m.78385 type:complete len:205 (-) Transcript_25455:1064-1678(-)